MKLPISYPHISTFIRTDLHNLQVGAMRLGGQFEQSPRIDPWCPTARGMPITQRDRTHENRPKQRNPSYAYTKFQLLKF